MLLYYNNVIIIMIIIIVIIIHVNFLYFVEKGGKKYNVNIQDEDG